MYNYKPMDSGQHVDAIYTKTSFKTHTPLTDLIEELIRAAREVADHIPGRPEEYDPPLGQQQQLVEEQIGGGGRLVDGAEDRAVLIRQVAHSAHHLVGNGGVWTGSKQSDRF